MPNTQLIPDAALQLPRVQIAGDESRWYALRTYPRHEKKVHAQLRQKGVTTFLPLVSEVHRWSDRKKTIQIPLFPGYAFVRLEATVHNRLYVLRTAGVVGFVGNGGTGLPIPDNQIEDIQKVLAHNIPCVLYPFLRVGQRVRIHSGCLEGLEGILVTCNSDRSLVVSVEAIHQSLAIRIEGYDVEILSPPQNSQCGRGRISRCNANDRH
ncbi:MAG: UpxY family transcription antiterminator [Acidobacteria bacterium]|nr:UpxY family transcription antiterminator [Acidobacteriota bacterium]